MATLTRSAFLISTLLWLHGHALNAQGTQALKEALWTEQRRSAFQNRQKTEATITVPYDVFLYGEVFRITVHLRNPSSSQLELPLAFDVRSGSISVEKKDSPQAKEFGLEYFRMAPEQQEVNPTCPTFILDAGKAITKEFWSIPTMNTFSLNLLLHSGKYRLVYQYGASNYAYFEVLGSLPVRMFKIVDLPDIGSIDRVRRRTALFTVRVGEHHWLFQVMPTTKATLNQEDMDHMPQLTTDEMPLFTRVARLPGPLTRLEASLIGDSTLHIEYQAADGMSRTIETKVETGEVIREW